MNRRLSNSLKVVFSTVLAIYLLIWACSSPLIKHFLAPELTKYALTLSPKTSIIYNPFFTRLTISDLEIKQADKTVVATQYVQIQVSLFQLVFKNVLIEILEIDGLVIKASQNNQTLVIAGIPIAPSDSTQPTTNTASENDTVNSSPFASLPYTISLPSLAVSNSKVEFIDNHQTHNLLIDELLISNVALDKKEQQAKLSLNASFNNAPIALSVDGQLQNMLGEIQVELAINNVELAQFIPYVDQPISFDGQANYEGSHTVIIDTDKQAFNTSNAELSLNNLQITQQKMSLNITQITHSLTDIALTLTNKTISQLSGETEIHVEEININNEQQQQLLNVAKFDLDNGQFQLVNNQPQLTLGQVAINQLHFSHSQQNDLPAIASINRISLSPIMLSANALEIGKVAIDQLVSNIIIDQEKNIANLVSLPETQQSNTPPSSVNEQATSAGKTDEIAPTPFIFSLGEFLITGENTINFNDKSVEPVYKRTIAFDQLTIGPLSNGENKATPTPVLLKGRSNTYAKFTLDGNVTPFADKPSYDINASLKEVSLVAVSSYMKDALELELKSGQLNADVQFKLIDEDIDGNVNLVVNGLETSIAEDHEANTVKDNAVVPLNAALGMLKDSNGDFELGVPLSGSTADPQFGITSFIALVTQKAVMSATQSYLIKTFVPYANVVSVAMTAGEYLLKITFEDLPYRIKQESPDEQQRQYIEQFSALLADKENAKVKICAISTPADIDLPQGQEITDKQTIKRLKALGQIREEQFKAHVIEQGNIDSARLLLCAPQIDTSEGATPRIELSL